METDELTGMIGIRLKSSFTSDSTGNQIAKLGCYKFFRNWCCTVSEGSKERIKYTLSSVLNRIWEDAPVLTLTDKQLLINIGKLVNGEIVEDVPPSFQSSGRIKRRWWSKAVSVFAEEESTDRLSDDYKVLLLERSTDIAEQLCLIERHLFECIVIDDLLKENAPEGNTLGKIVDHFNAMCEWFVHEIMMKDQPVNIQFNKIRKLIKVSYKCHARCNYSSTVQITLALQNAQVSSLKDAWSRIGGKERAMFEELANFTSPVRNFKILRAALKSLKEDTPVVPFLAITVSDLQSILEAPNDYDGPLVPWYKYRGIAQILKQVKDLQRPERTYPIERRPALLAFLKSRIKDHMH